MYNPVNYIAKPLVHIDIMANIKCVLYISVFAENDLFIVKY